MIILHLDKTTLSRKEWLKEHNLSEEEIFQDEDGEYFLDTVDIDPSEPGGVYQKKVYLPPNTLYEINV